MATARADGGGSGKADRAHYYFCNGNGRPAFVACEVRRFVSNEDTMLSGVAVLFDGAKFALLGAIRSKNQVHGNCDELAKFVSELAKVGLPSQLCTRNRIAVVFEPERDQRDALLHGDALQRAMHEIKRFHRIAEYDVGLRASAYEDLWPVDQSACQNFAQILVQKHGMWTAMPSVCHGDAKRWTIAAIGASIGAWQEAKHPFSIGSPLGNISVDPLLVSRAVLRAKLLYDDAMLKRTLFVWMWTVLRSGKRRRLERASLMDVPQGVLEEIAGYL